MPNRRTIEIVTHTAPRPADSSLSWGFDYGEACATFQRLCIEYPEHLIQQYSGKAHEAYSDLDAYIRASFAKGTPVGTLVTDRPARVDGLREIITVVTVTDAQYDTIRTTDPYGFGTLTAGADGLVYLTRFFDDEVSEATIAPDGTVTTLARGLDADGWQGDSENENECVCAAESEPSCICGHPLGAVEAPLLR